MRLTLRAAEVYRLVLSSVASELIVSQHLDAKGFDGDQPLAVLQGIAGSGKGAGG